MTHLVELQERHQRLRRKLHRLKFACIRASSFKQRIWHAILCWRVRRIERLLAETDAALQREMAFSDSLI